MEKTSFKNDEDELAIKSFFIEPLQFVSLCSLPHPGHSSRQGTAVAACLLKGGRVYKFPLITFVRTLKSIIAYTISYAEQSVYHQHSCSFSSDAWVWVGPGLAGWLAGWLLQIPWPVVIIIIFSCLISTVCGLGCSWVVSLPTTTIETTTTTTIRCARRSFVHLAVLFAFSSPSEIYPQQQQQRQQQQ